ncbi:MAG: hypothetical protein HKN70_06270 [Gammaproteobacteria bacterium]|nr:hypothetical protein [Gammaproteobacteria bacterium]
MTSQARESGVLNLAVLGATGRMGREIIQLMDGRKDLNLSGASAGDAHERLGQPLTRRIKLDTPAAALADAHVAIDFSLPAGVSSHIETCCAMNVPYVCGVTGLSASHDTLMHEASQVIPVFRAPNMSIGVNLCIAAAASIAAGLAADFDVSILDIHHAGKRDVPSGTALEFGGQIEAVATPNKVAYDSIREGEYPGEHLVRFSLGEELIELRHRAGSRREFAVGALRAAAWLADQPPGLYNMRNLLDIRSSS